MNIRFIDTSVMTNLLDIPEMNQDKERVILEWSEVLQNKETLIMPIATIIETGNHIAHIVNGYKRREVAIKYIEYLRKTAENEAPWILYGNNLDTKSLRFFVENFETNALNKTGIGDLSIIEAYQRYKESQPAIGTIRIWSMDAHLNSYCEENVGMSRRRSK